jgi:hypothetical protein
VGVAWIEQRSSARLTAPAGAVADSAAETVVICGAMALLRKLSGPRRVGKISVPRQITSVFRGVSARCGVLIGVTVRMWLRSC